MLIQVRDYRSQNRLVVNKLDIPNQGQYSASKSPKEDHHLTLPLINVKIGRVSPKARPMFPFQYAKDSMLSLDNSQDELREKLKAYSAGVREEILNDSDDSFHQERIRTQNSKNRYQISNERGKYS